MMRSGRERPWWSPAVGAIVSALVGLMFPIYWIAERLQRDDRQEAWEHVASASHEAWESIGERVRKARRHRRRWLDRARKQVGASSERFWKGARSAPRRWTHEVRVEGRKIVVRSGRRAQKIVKRAAAGGARRLARLMRRQAYR